MVDNFVGQLRQELHDWEIELAIEQRKQAADRIEQLSNALSKYSCKCTEPCALYKAEKEREGDMPHMMCGWWSVAALNGDK